MKIRIIIVFLTNGLEARRTTLSWQSSIKTVQYEGITSSTMSFWFVILLKSSSVLAIIFKTRKQSAHLLPRNLWFFAFVLYRWPK